MAKQILHEDRILLVEVPEGLPDLEMFGFEAGATYNNIYTTNEEYEFHSLPYGILPPIKTNVKVSEWEILGIASKLTKGQIEEILKPESMIIIGLPPMTITEWKDYEGKGNWATAFSSFKSLLSHHQLTPNETLVLIKK